MTKYKIKVSIDEEIFFVVVNNWFQHASVIWNPTEDDLKDDKSVSYSSTNICPLCRKENNVTDDSILYPKNVCCDTDNNGNKTNEWVCRKHGRRHYEKYNNNSQANIIKCMRNQTGNDPSRILGYNCERLTEKWLEAKRLAVKYDNYSNLPLDHDLITKHILVMIEGKLIDLYGKVPQTKGARLKYGR